MAINLTDFDKIWASTSPLTPYSFSDANYQEGWNFVGSTPPARQMWDSYMKFSDEKQQYIVNNFLPLSGGTMTGAISTSSTDFISKTNNTTHLTIAGGSAYSNSASLRLAGGEEVGQTGLFQLRAQDGTIYKDFVGKPDGTLQWGGKDVITAAGGTMTGNIFFNETEGRVAMSASQNEAGRLRLIGGSGLTNGAQLLLSGKSHSSTAGQFQLGANDGTNSASLLGKPDGTLTWGGSNVAVMGTLQNGHGILTGSVSNISVAGNSYASGTVDFGQTFSSSPIVITCCSYGHAHVSAGCYSITTTGFTYMVSNENTASYTNERINWIAIG